MRIAGKVQFYLKMGEEIPNEFQMIWNRSFKLSIKNWNFEQWFTVLHQSIIDMINANVPKTGEVSMKNIKILIKKACIRSFHQSLLNISVPILQNVSELMHNKWRTLLKSRSKKMWYATSNKPVKTWEKLSHIESIHLE